MFNKTMTKSGLHAPHPRRIFGKAKTLKKWIRPFDDLRELSHENALKGIQKNDRLLSRENAVHAGASIIIQDIPEQDFFPE
jgi:hypothetical protein